MASKRRLGKSLTDLLSQIEDNKSTLDWIIPQSDATDVDTESEGLAEGWGGLVPGAKREYRQRLGELPSEYVEDAKPPKDNYGQGPSRSTRVAVHKFVPNMLGRAMGEMTPQTLGTVYVKFQPHLNGKHGNDIYRYNNVPKNVYDMFANSNSKGAFINTHLNAYPYRRINSREDRANTEDF